MARTPSDLVSQVRIHRRHVWVSEPASIGFVLLVSLVLAVVCGVILWNGSRIRSQQKAIARLKADNSSHIRHLAELRDKQRISSTLISFTKRRIAHPTLSEVVDLVYDHSTRFGYDPLLLLAVIHVESVFDPQALGRYRSGEYSGAMGLMQLKFETAQSVAQNLGIVLSFPEDLLRPEVNIPLGVAYLTQLIGQFRSLKLGVLAYNLGPGLVSKSLSEKLPLPVRYYRKVLRSYYQLRAHAPAA